MLVDLLMTLLKYHYTKVIIIYCVSRFYVAPVFSQLFFNGDLNRKEITEMNLDIDHVIRYIFLI